MARVPEFNEGTRRALQGLRPSNLAPQAYREAAVIESRYGLESAGMVARGYNALARGVEGIGRGLTEAGRAQARAGKAQEQSLKAQEYAQAQQQSVQFATRFASLTTAFDTEMNKMAGVGTTYNIPGIGVIKGLGTGIGMPSIAPPPPDEEEAGPFIGGAS